MLMLIAVVVFMTRQYNRYIYLTTKENQDDIKNFIKTKEETEGNQ